MGWAFLSLFCLQGIYQMTNRSNLRAQYDIEGSCGDDCCSSFCCCCCALVQEYKETAVHVAPPPGAAQPSLQPQMMYSPSPEHQVAYFPQQLASPRPAPAATPAPSQGMTAAEAQMFTGFAQDATTIAVMDIKADAGSS